ncbi:hypothetical protein VTN96DRAFT_3130 [Rasamsonia emersonii]|uniref:Dynamin-binding protein n=1 Tax=Rasamsonia emersonii (strain ATCC 16479 / CBS 393.64 / IMI 116815) TaxID=1408163 RepID=A0A0F4YZN7_RASE3|nr:Rho guanyl nucleotide exchange factor [Rasamsonia emersonii CBS 393.64]KKA23694.1 Rho guanyl nucleotide exchange factor [Rasamsonia emersonii CBS 393.64]
MPDVDDDCCSVSSVQQQSHPFSERPSSQQSHQNVLAAAESPLDHASTVPSSSPPSPAILLPATTYAPQSPQQQQQHLHQQQQQQTQQSLAVDSSVANHRQTHPDEPPSPDPRDFYRSYTADTADDASKTPPRLGSILPPEIENGMTTVTSPRRVYTLSSVQSDPSQWPRSSQGRPYQFRSASGGSSIYSGDTPPRTQPVLSTGARIRQSSLKELVDRFNQTVDEVPPVPLRTPRTAVSPTRSLSGSRRSERDPSSASRKPSPSRTSQADSASHQSPDPPSHSVAQAKDGGSESRRPLFGELLTIDTTVNNPGYGIPSHVRRRGSDSSVPSPNPFFLEARADGDPAVSPSSPTAWYLGYTPSLEAINTGRSHRRSRSDASWTTCKPAVTSDLNTHMTVASPPAPSSTVSPGGSHSKSRIPVSSQRLSTASSDSGNSSPSTRANSATGLYCNANANQVPLAPKGSSRLPKPKSPTSPSQSLRVPPAVKSPTRRETGRGHGTPGHLSEKGSLKAYITAPPPKKSPPLRSSRPRQPVSSATTTASRAKVVDRVSHFQSSSHNDSDSRSSRPTTRRLPELGNVDFAARRQKIQQAFNKSLEENAKKQEEAAERRRLARFRRDEEMRSRLLREGELRKMESARSLRKMESAKELNKTEPAKESDKMESSSASSPEKATSDNNADGPRDDSAAENNKELDTPISPDEQVTPTTPHLTIDTTAPSVEREPDAVQEQSRLDLGDSPTLGQHAQTDGVRNTSRSDADDSALPPSSAVTAETNDTDTTHFDPEPQVDMPLPGASHRTILSRIMQLRESSSSSECDEDSNDDDKESIQIMLEPSASSTFYFDSVDSGDSHNGELNDEHERVADEQLKRWSMASWPSSSFRDQQSLPESHADQNEDALPSADQSSPELFVSGRDSNQFTQHWSTLDRYPSSNDSLHDRPTMDSSGDRNQRSHRDDVPPNLIRQGGWDSKRVTQLYLEELTRGRSRGSLSFRLTERSWELAQPDGEAEVASKADSLTDDPVLVPRADDLTVSHRPSLSLRDDWESASPSIADWMQVAAGDLPPPPPPPKDEEGDSVARDEAPTPVAPTSDPAPSKPEESWDGLGLAIHVQPPAEPVRIAPTPPVPDHSPPPPPIPDKVEDASSQPPPPHMVSPSIYASEPPSSIPPSAPFGSAEDDQPVRSSEESSFAQAGFTPSPETAASSATSQHQASAAASSAEVQESLSTAEQARLKKRRNVIKELVDTEYTFGQDMKVVDDIYKGTSSSCLDLSAEDVRTLFGNSDQVVQFSMNFQDALKQAARSVYVMPKSQRWRSKRGTRSDQASPQPDAQSSTTNADTPSVEQDNQTFIGQVFMENMAQMEKVYTDYLKNHDAANKKLQVLQRNPKVAIWLKECRDWASDLTTAWDLDSLLVKPVQRILKYPLLLTQLIEATPNDHPDRAALVSALEGVTNISVRINELKKRADLVGQVVSSRKRKESDVRAGLSKAFGRRTEKLKQQVGLSEMFEDKQYDALSQQFNDSFFQLQVVMRDVEMYTREIQSGMDRFHEYVTAIEGCIDVAQSNYTEVESKWHRLRMAVRDIVTVALPEHIATVRKSVIDPMITLLKLYDGPQKVMHKRNKRLIDYARFKAIKDRGDKPDKKTAEQGEQFTILNDALKDELPKLFSLTAKLMEACLNNFVEIQVRWFSMFQKKLSFLIDQFPSDIESIVSDWSADFAFADAQILSLSLCNGALLSDAVNLVNFNTPSTEAGASSPRRPSTVTNSSVRTGSGTMENSPKVSYDFSNAGSSSQTDGQSQHGRRRTNSSMSAVARAASEMANGQVNSGTTSQVASARPSTDTTRTEPFPSLPRLSLDMPFMNDPLLNDPEHFEATMDETTASPNGRYSGFFSSAMPMSDSPRQETPPEPEQSKDPKVLFLAASLYEFNIDRPRQEAGYPYLTYAAGEIFDVIGEKGELWLARNQDDPNRQVGWIWTKHFAKLSS